MKNAADRLAIELDDPTVGAFFSVAEKFHRNFYHGFLEDFEIESDRVRVNQFVARMMALAENGAAQQ